MALSVSTLLARLHDFRRELSFADLRSKHHHAE
jgi:hypothetical protein